MERINDFLKESSFLLLVVDQEDRVYTCSNDEQGKVYPLCKFHDPWGKDFVQGLGHINQIVKMHYIFSTLSIDQTN